LSARPNLCLSRIYLFTSPGFAPQKTLPLVIFDAIASRKLHLRRLAPVFLQLDFVAQLEALHLVEVLDNSGTIVTLPIKWAEVRREAKQLTD